MNKIFALVLILCFISPISEELHAQSPRKSTNTKRKSKEEYKPFSKDKFWYGGGFNLQFYQAPLPGTNILGNVFEFGLSPLVGYKLTKWLSVGPRLEFNYFGGRFRSDPVIYKLNGFTYGGGIFTRAKFLNLFFAHFEYATSSNLFITGLINNNNRIDTERGWQDHLYLGLGYNATATWSYEFYVLYDFLAPDDTDRLPFNFRAGFTYNF